MKILFEDEYFLVVSKPSGMVVNISSSSPKDTLQNWAMEKIDFKMDEGDDFITRSGIVHRLDKDTSGLITIAKDRDVFYSLQKLFQVREVEKTYLSLVHGDTPVSGTVIAPVGRLPWDRTKFGVIAEGRPAETGYQKIGLYIHKGSKYSYLKVFPKTGRTHQIRVHFKHQGYPVVADPLYSGRKVYRDDLLFCPRLFLHSSGLKFIHPVTGKVVECEDPLGEDLFSVLERMDPENILVKD